ncbi:Uncharacterised protein [Mycobacteroides abscessus subsp. abscessus]|nr:Uncharacterised protein [Mycobacteroides abscessus subsp. abscessus]
MHLTRQRQDTKKLLFQARLRTVSDTTPIDKRLIKDLREQLTVLEARIRKLDGAIDDGDTDGTG